MIVLVTGIAGFIGSNTAKKLLERGDEVVGIDNFNDYYDPTLKERRISDFLGEYDFKVYRLDIADKDAIRKVFEENKIDKICHLAAQAGVRYSIENPDAYIQANIVGTNNLLELAKDFKINDFVFASSSSVYGGNTNFPFSESDNVDSPISLYAATKKTNELQAHVYHRLYGMNCIGLRFFTVYGPWGRPDMALFKFTKNILAGKPIDVFNSGKHKRDFTYIDDIVFGIIASLDNCYGYEIFNLGNNKPVDLEYFISTIENKLGKKAIKNYLPLQTGDVPETYANIDKAGEKLGYKSKVSIEEGIERFLVWYKQYYENKNMIGFIGQGWIGKNYANNFEDRGYEVVRYALETPYIDNKEKIKDCDFVFIAVPTPSTPDGFDDSILRDAVSLVGEGKVAIIKSTILPGTTESIQKENPNKYVFHSPEFLTEVTAAADAASPNRNIIGIAVDNEDHRRKAQEVIDILPRAHYQLVCRSEEAELIKYGGNCWFYFKVIYINMLYDLAKKHNCKWEIVRDAMAADPRIGRTHLDPIHKSGRGAGGHCFIKDFSAFTEMYERLIGDEAGRKVLDSLKDKNIDLLLESNKDLDLLKGVYGDDVTNGKQ